jgi:putative transposase
MIVGMRTRVQAAKVAAATGGAHLAGKPNPEGAPRLSRYVDVGVDFEAHRLAVESVSVLFDLYAGDTDCYAQTGSPGALFPTGWTVTAARFEVEWPAEPQRAGLVRSHFGARRKAFNWGLAKVKADLDAKAVDPGHESVGWDLGSLRGAWNRAKDEVAPWWAANSKEAYSSGLADLARALDNWSASKSGARRGRRVGFPRFKSARREAGRVRFTTGTMGVAHDRRTITVPVIGPLRSKENTRRVQRHVASGRARILNMTLSQRWGRLFVSISYALRAPGTVRTVARPSVVAGIDLGVRTLATVATIDTITGEQTITEYANPAPLKATLAALRRAGRTFPPHPRIARPPGIESQADPAGPPVRAPAAGSHPSAHHLAGVQLWPHRDRRPRRGRHETQYGPARLPACRLRCGDGFGRDDVGLQDRPPRRGANRGGSLVPVQPDPSRLHYSRRHRVPADRQRAHRQVAGVSSHRRRRRPRSQRLA